MSDGKPKRPPRGGPAVNRSSASITASQQPAVTLVPAEPSLTPASGAAEVAEPAPLIAITEPEPEPAMPAAKLSADSPAGAWDALIEAQGVLARGAEEMTMAISGVTRLGIAATADAVIALLGARTLAEAVEINAGLARRNADAIIVGAAKLSEIGVKAAGEAMLPLLSRCGAGWPDANAG